MASRSRVGEPGEESAGEDGDVDGDDAADEEVVDGTELIGEKAAIDTWLISVAKQVIFF